MERREVMDAINRIQYCETKAEAAQLTKKIVRALGAENFMYTLMQPPGVKNPEPSFHFLIGCDAEFCRVYAERMWLLNDPFLNYAYKNTRPQLNTMITKYTLGQVEMAELGAQYGLKSGLVIPTHTNMDAGQCTGLLYVGSSLEREIGEPLLLAKRAQFAGLALELLWWWGAYLKRLAMEIYQITEEEVFLLQRAKEGKIAGEIGVLIKKSANSVYRRLDKIKAKLEVKNIGLAVQEAQALGLLD
ncbi:autoinducer binding domain-containing protein [Neisseriaceae bacterium TC5R-5]|nr:autoinducer binding domain-containing protein [Neisseriaceae bacterium TC5R-5]